MIFADDTQISLRRLPSELESDARDNGLKLNLSKSKVRIQGSNTFI